MKLSRCGLRADEVSSSQFTPIFTSTSVGTLCIKKENHELISTWHPFIWHFYVFAVVLGCGQIELNNSLFRGMDRFHNCSGRITVEGRGRPNR